MILSPPIPWRDVPVGAVVLLWGEPRTVSMVAPGVPLYATLYFEGIPGAMMFSDDMRTQLVMLDEADAVTALAVAGLNPEIIDTKE